MKIYTKTGDAGETGLFGGARVQKDHLRIQSYGTLDELNAAIGIATATDSSFLPEEFSGIQAEIFQLGAELATPADKKVSTALIEPAEIEKLEHSIDAMEKELSPLKTFILPGGTLLAAQLHLARTICRRAERELVVLNRVQPLRPAVLQYVNRLSDFLFVASRFANHSANIPDIPWNPKKS